MDFNSSDPAAQEKKARKGYGQGRSIIHTNVAEALKMRQVGNVYSYVTSFLAEQVVLIKSSRMRICY